MTPAAILRAQMESSTDPARLEREARLVEDMALLPPKTAEDPSPAASMQCVTIDKGVPLPPLSKGPRGPRAKYPYRQIEIGESFRIDLAGRDPATAALRTREHAKRFRPLRFAVRVAEENGEQIVRVWRTA